MWCFVLRWISPRRLCISRARFLFHSALSQSIVCMIFCAPKEVSSQGANSEFHLGSNTLEIVLF